MSVLWPWKAIFRTALREGLCWFASTAGERLAKKYITLPAKKRRNTRSKKGTRK